MWVIWSRVRDQVGQIGAVLDQYCGAHGSMMTGFDPGAFGQNPAVVAMYESSVAIGAGQDARAGELEGVFAREVARAEVLEAEAARERAKWGWIKAVGAVVTIAVGVVVVVVTAGAATPLVVLGAAAASTLFGASDLVEAVGDIYYGSKGDAYTQAFNPLRDTVFAGNQTMYDAVGFGVCAVASAGIPIGLAAKAGTVARMGGVARASLREGVEDLATQKAAEWATPYLEAEAALGAGILAGGSLGKVGGGTVPKTPSAPPKTGTGGIPTPKTPDVPKPKAPDVPKAQPVGAPDAGKAPSSTPVRGNAPGAGPVRRPDVAGPGTTPGKVGVDVGGQTGTGGAGVTSPSRSTVVPDVLGVNDLPLGHYGGYSSRPSRHDYAAEEAWASQTYDEFRKDSTLALDIADSTGWSRSEVEQILDHLLRREHLMEDYESGKLVRRTFDPDARQADALIRLRSGTGTPADMLLLRHEWAESECLRLNPDATYETAHAHANKIADWWSAVRELEGI